MITARTLTITFGAVSAAIIALAIMLIAVAQASACPHDCGYRQHHDAWWWQKYERRQERRRHRHVRRVEPRRAVIIHKHRDRDDDDDVRCKWHLSVVGDQYASESGAQGEADKAWMQTARWLHGERYMSREAARDIKYECGRSSVGSLVGQVFYRCRITARPCSPEAKRAD